MKIHLVFSDVIAETRAQSLLTDYTSTILLLNKFNKEHWMTLWPSTKFKL